MESVIKKGPADRLVEQKGKVYSEIRQPHGNALY